jgi:hypothetical protein
VAAVLGVIKTMGSINSPVEILGQMIGGLKQKLIPMGLTPLEELSEHEGKIRLVFDQQEACRGCVR